jgi:glycogen operon protein
MGFVRRLFHFRTSHPALRPAQYFSGQDHNGNGLKDIAWLRSDGSEASGGFWNDAGQHVLAWRVDGTECNDSAPSLFVAYNGGSGVTAVTLPPPLPGRTWRRVSDTAAWMEPQDNFRAEDQEDLLGSPVYSLAPRSVLLLIEK